MDNEINNNILSILYNFKLLLIEDYNAGRWTEEAIKIIEKELTEIAKKYIIDEELY
jgi:hypothetical protein